MRRKFLISFLIFSIIGIVFFRPLIFKREVKIEFDRNVVLDTIYYSHGFPITTKIDYLEKDRERIFDIKLKFIIEEPFIIQNKYKMEDIIKIRPKRGDVWFEKALSDVDVFEAYNYFPGLQMGFHRFAYFLVINGKSSEISFKIKARNRIEILVIPGITNGKLEVIVNDKKYYFDYNNLKYYNVYQIDTRDAKNLYKFYISPESKSLMIKLKDNVKDLKVKHLKYKIIDSNRIEIDLEQIDYLNFFLNCILVIFYCLILTAILMYVKSSLVKGFAIIFTIFLIYFLSYFPGIYNGDACYQVSQACCIRINDLHATFHTFTMMIILKIFNHIGFYVLIQIILASILFAWIITRLKLNLPIYIILLAFLFPITGLYSIYAIKDIPFSLSLVWFSLLLYLAYKDENYLKNKLVVIALVISVLFVMLFRYNGILTGILSIIIAIFLLKHHFKRMIIVLILTILSFICFQYMFYNVLRVERSWTSHQIDYKILGAYVKSNYKFGKKDIEIIEEIFSSLEDIKLTYRCNLNVPMMRSADKKKLIEYKDKIRRIVLNAILDNPIPLMEHIVCVSYYTWGLTTTMLPYRKNHITREVREAKLYSDIKLPQVQSILEMLINKLKILFKVLNIPALYFYIIVLFGILYKDLRILILPSVLNTFVMAFASTEWNFRYLYSNYLISIVLWFFAHRYRALKF